MQANGRSRDRAVVRMRLEEIFKTFVDDAVPVAHESPFARPVGQNLRNDQGQPSATGDSRATLAPAIPRPVVSRHPERLPGREVGGPAAVERGRGDTSVGRRACVPSARCAPGGGTESVI